MRKLERVLTWLLPAASFLAVLLICLGQASRKPFWYDEFVTLRISQLETSSAVIQFFESGKDTTSFLPALLVHAMGFFPGRREVVTRLPFVAAFMLTCVCIYFFIRKRHSVGYGVMGTLMFAAGYSLYYATEIRAYVFLLLGAAFGQLCWQKANEEGRYSGLASVGVFAGLAVAIAFHDFAIFLFVPFALAQWVQERSSSRRRRGVWIALLTFPLATLITLPGTLAAKHIYGATFWSKPTLDHLIQVYGLYLRSMENQVPVALIVLAACVWLGIRGQTEGRQSYKDGAARSQFSPAEWTLIFGLCFLPLIGYVGSLALGVFTPRYVLPFFIGMAILGVGVFTEWIDQSDRMGWAMGLVLLGLTVAQNPSALIQGIRVLAGRQFTGTMPTEYQKDWADFVRPIPLPIATESGSVIFDVDYYGDPEVKSRMVVLTSRGNAMRWKTMTGELNMEIFGAPLHLPTRDFDAFVAANPRFLLIVDPRMAETSWLLKSLAEESEIKQDVRVTLIREHKGESRDDVYLVEFDVQGPQ